MDDARRAALEAKIARLSPARQKLVRARLGGSAALAADELQPGIGGAGEFPMSETQKGFWFIEQLEPGSHMFHLPLVSRVRGKADFDALRRAVSEIMRRHDMLRARVSIDGAEPMFQVDLEAEIPCDVIDLSDMQKDQRDVELHRIGDETLHRPFDFRTGPLLRLVIVREAADQCVLFLVFHHLVCDGWSVEMFFRELGAIYNAFRAGKPSPLPELEWRFADYVAWERRTRTPEKLERQLAYWQANLRGAPQLSGLPLDRPRPNIADHEGDLVTVTIGAEEVGRIVSFSRGLGLTPYMTYVGAFAVLLARWSNSEDVVVGTPIFNRPRREFEALIGLFVNSLALRFDLSGNATVRDYLTGHVKTQVLDAFSNQDVPFNRVVRAIRPEHGASHSPVFQVLFSYQSYGLDPSVALGDLVAIELPGLRSKSTYELTFELHDRPDGGIALHAEFATQLFDRSTIVRMLHHYTALLSALVEAPHVPVMELPLLSAEERRVVLSDWNQTQAAFPDTRTYPGLFREVARARPDAVAAREHGIEMSYGQLDVRSDVLAGVLAHAGVERDRLVPLLLPRSIPLVTSIVAVWKAGAAYTPIDPEFPPDRIAHIVRACEASVLCAAAELEPLVRSLVADGAVDAGLRVMYVDRDGGLARGAGARVPTPALAAAPSDVAYCIFTSGSTGTPKGALIEQRGMLNHMYAKIDALALKETDNVAATASPCFDISVWQYLTVLLLGGRVSVFDDDTTHSARNFIEQLVDDEVTVAEIVPSFLRVLLPELERMGDRRPSLHRLRWLILTGEALSAALCNRWLGLYPHIPVVNAYGPTECSDDVTHHVLREPVSTSTDSVPIGRPIANTQLYVVDRRLGPVPVGVQGEILVGGVGVGRGYLRDAERTAAVFLDDPFVPGGRIYRTGDLGRFRADGTLEMLGRLDHQVKIRGFRIEPGEVQEVLARHPSVRAVAIVAVEDGNEVRLVAYVVPETGVECAVVELREFLKGILPVYMVPSLFVLLTKLPLTPNGKLDRAALPAPKQDAVVDEAEAPLSELEQVLRSIWGEVLGHTPPGIHDGFFDLGGHSLLAVELVDRVQGALGVQFALRDLFAAPTIAQQAQLIEQCLHEGVMATVPLADVDDAAQLPPDLPSITTPPAGTSEPRSVLLTGATGFLGSYLLHDLLEQTDADVHCLVRAERMEDGRKRLQRTLESRGLWRKQYSSRLVAVAGDLELPRLGLTRRAFSALAGTVDAIYHNGAQVSLLYPYGPLKAANVDGTREVIRLAVTERTKPVHYVSTLAVFPGSVEEPLTFQEDDRPGDLKVPEGGYPRSKLVAERMLMNARERGLPVAIYRPPEITWHSRTGDWNTESVCARSSLPA